jgi:hypothetical protein
MYVAQQEANWHRRARIQKLKHVVLNNIKFDLTGQDFCIRFWWQEQYFFTVIFNQINNGGMEK